MTTLLPLLALAALPTSGIEWRDDAFSTVLQRAEAQERPVLVYFWMDGSEYCTKFWQETLSQESVQSHLTGYTCYSANNGTDRGHELVEQFNVPTLPYVLFLNPDGSPEDAVGGYIDQGGFLEEVARIGRGENTLSDLQEKAEAVDATTDEGIEALWLLAGKLQDLGMDERHGEVLVAIKSADPVGRTKIAGQLLLQEVFREIEEAATGAEPEGDGYDEYAEPDYGTWDLKPAYTYLKKVENAEVALGGWAEVARIEALRGELKVAIKNYGKAEKHCTPENHASFCSNAADFLIRLEGDLDNKAEKFLVKMAETGVAAYEERLASDTVQVSKTEGREYEKPSPEGLGWHLYTLARAYDRVGQRDRAIEVAQRMLTILDNDETRGFLAELQAEPEMEQG